MSERIEQLVSPQGWRIWDEEGNWLGDVIIRPGDAGHSPSCLPITPANSTLAFAPSRASAIAALQRWRKAARAKARRAELKALPDGSVSADHGPLVDDPPVAGKRCRVYGCGRPIALHNGMLVHLEEVPS